MDGRTRSIALHGCAGATVRTRLEQICRGRAGDDAIGYRVRVALVDVARLPDAAEQLHAATLLNDVRCLVCRGVQIGRPTERDMVAGGVRRGADGGACGCGRAADVGDDSADVVSRAE